MIAEQVSLVVMEETGTTGRSSYLLEGAGFEVMLVKEGQVKNMKGSKRDV